MRIIDKNNDFYDYLQDSTDTLVFDRRGSYLITKESLCSSLSWYDYRSQKYRFLLLQCGATFWLILLKVKKMDKYNNKITDYEMEVLNSWRNYDKPNDLLKLDFILFSNTYKIFDYKINDYVYENIKNNVKDFVDSINRNDYRYYNIFKCDLDSNVYRIPLLKACGFGNIVDVQEMFCAIEEYFSIEKMKLETTEPKGSTNNIKIEMHGFDTKSSFRKMMA